MANLLDYSGPVAFRSRAPIEVCVRRLKAIVKRNSPAFAFFSASSRPLLVGRVEKDKVALHRILPLIGNPYKPYFYGTFTHEGDATVLRGQFTMSRLVKTLWSLLLIVPVVVALVLAISLIDPNTRTQASPLILVMVIVAVIDIGLAAITKKVSYRDVTWISETIKSALED